jgi:coenzyme F420-reducing hydrogenase delta subunit
MENALPVSYRRVRGGEIPRMSKSNELLESSSVNEQNMTTNRTPRIYVFCCLSHLEASGIGELEGNAGMKVIPLPCSGKIDIRYLVKVFETGADGAVLVTCSDGDCRYLEGNRRARNRAEAVDKLLVETGLGRGRLRVIQVGDGGAKQVVSQIGEFAQWLQGLPSAAAVRPPC